MAFGTTEIQWHFQMCRARCGVSRILSGYCQEQLTKLCVCWSTCFHWSKVWELWPDSPPTPELRYVMTIPDSGKTGINVYALCCECVWPLEETVELGHRPGSGANPLTSSLSHFIFDHHWYRVRKRQKTIHMQQRHLHLCLLVSGGGLLGFDPQLYSQVSPCQAEMGQLNPGIQPCFS